LSPAWAITILADKIHYETQHVKRMCATGIVSKLGGAFTLPTHLHGVDGHHGVDMSSPLLPEGVPETDTNLGSYYQPGGLVTFGSGDASRFCTLIQSCKHGKNYFGFETGKQKNLNRNCNARIATL